MPLVLPVRPSGLPVERALYSAVAIFCFSNGPVEDQSSQNVYRTDPRRIFKIGRHEGT